jgi:GNAT superfamily N-acetyltransferase
MTHLSIDDLQPQLAANRRYWAGWAGAEPETDLPIYRTDIAHRLLNGVLRVRNRPLDESIDEARTRLKGSSWSWWVGADSDEGTADGLLAHGAQQIGDLPIMALDVSAVPTVPRFSVPDGLTIRPVTGRDEMTKYVRAYAEPLGFDQSHVEAVVAREMAFAYPEVIRTEVAGLYCIATDAGHRRSGIATALTVEALRLARESGRTVATLQASSDGEPVYRRIGFETVSRYALFRLPE